MPATASFDIASSVDEAIPRGQSHGHGYGGGQDLVDGPANITENTDNKITMDAPAIEDANTDRGTGNEKDQDCRDDSTWTSSSSAPSALPKKMLAVAASRRSQQI